MTMSGLKSWLRRWLGVTHEIEVQRQARQMMDDTLLGRLEQLEEWVGARTHAGVDVHFPGAPFDANWIIVVGRYRDRDYVRCFHVPERTLGELVPLLSSVERRCSGSLRVDAPPSFSAMLAGLMGREPGS